MKISQLFKNKNDKPIISFEIFPPQKEEAFENVGIMLKELSYLEPKFISVTCGAGGSSNRNKTIELASKIKNEFNIESMAHMTCISSTPDSVLEEVKAIQDEGIENILALRGDIPKEGFEPEKASYSHAFELIKEIKTNSELCVAAGAYPEGHIECDDFNKSIEHMKIKEEAGADFFVSQLFFDNRYFYRFFEAAEKAGITVPITPGIMPMMSKSQISNMIFMCGASLPSEMVRILYKYESSPDDLLKAGIEYAGRQISDLVKNNTCGIHLYSMNKPEIAKQLLEYV